MTWDSTYMECVKHTTLLQDKHHHVLFETIFIFLEMLFEHCAHSSMQTGMREAAFVVQTTPSSVVQTLWTHSYTSVLIFTVTHFSIALSFCANFMYILHMRSASSFSLGVTPGFRAWCQTAWEPLEELYRTIFIFVTYYFCFSSASCQCDVAGGLML